MQLTPGIFSLPGIKMYSHTSAKAMLGSESLNCA
jgi:hypothetical protein